MLLSHHLPGAFAILRYCYELSVRPCASRECRAIDIKRKCDYSHTTYTPESIGNTAQATKHTHFGVQQGNIVTGSCGSVAEYG